MTTYKVLKETTPGQFTDTSEVFSGTPDEAQAQTEVLQAQFGVCFAMQETIDVA